MRAAAVIIAYICHMLIARVAYDIIIIILLFIFRPPSIFHSKCKIKHAIIFIVFIFAMMSHAVNVIHIFFHSGGNVTSRRRFLA